MKRRKIFARIVFLLYFAAVLYLCFGNFSDLSSVPGYFLGIPSDKIVHFLMFLPFPVLFYMAFGWRTSRPWHSILLAVGILAIGSAIAAGTEIIQDFIPYRESNAMDFLADFAALCLSAVITIIIDLTKTKRHA